MPLPRRLPLPPSSRPWPTSPTSAFHVPWYLPSAHGDIRLDAAGDEATVVVLTKLSRLERAALATLRTWTVMQDLHRARGGIKASRLLFPEVTDDLGATEAETRIVINAPLGDVQKVLARTLKPSRVLVGVVHFTDGTIEEVSRSEPPPVDVATMAKTETHASGAYRETIPEPKPVPESCLQPEPKPKESLAKKVKKAAADVGATLAAPTIGCPPPNFPAREERANRVLEKFLTPAQYADWRKDQCFIQAAHDTGHRYLLTSRLNRGALARVGGRSLFDLDENVPYCTHDWDVPAAEELLSLSIFLALPGGEGYLRTVPADPYLGR